MTLYLDTEFNGFGGALISLALVSSRDHDEFYGVLPLPTRVHPWVAEHVVPFLFADPEPHHKFRARLAAYLRKHAGERIVADWPEDFTHLMHSICEPGGVSLELELVLWLVNSSKLYPKVPHNALSDARALMEWHQRELSHA